MKIKDLIEILKDRNENDYIAFRLWDTDDVLDCTNEKLNQEEINNILDKFQINYHYFYQPDIMINTIEEYLMNRSIKKK